MANDDTQDGMLGIALALGIEHEALRALGRRLGEALSAGIQGVLATDVVAECDAITLTEATAVAADLADPAHIAFAIRFSTADGAAAPLIAVMPTDDLGALFMIDTSAAQLADPDFAARQVELVAAGVRELLDISATLLFVDELAGAEIALEGATLQGAVDALTALAGAPVLRLKLSFGLSSGAGVQLVLALPASLAARLAGSQSPGLAPEAGADLDGDPDSYEGAAAGNISRFRPPADGSDVHPVRFPHLDNGRSSGPPQQLDLIMDVMLRVTVELGRSRMTVEDVLNLGAGAVVELDKLAGEPVDILVNDRPIARGEVVVVDENFGVRVTEILSPRSRVQALAH